MLRTAVSFSRKHGQIRTPSSSPTLQPKSLVDLRCRASLIGVRLTAEEVSLLQSRAGRLLPRGTRPTSLTANLTRDEFHVSRKRFLGYARRRQDVDFEREAMLAVIEAPAEKGIAKHLFTGIGIVGTMSWATAGTQAAGEAGMHIIGCSLVGCISALGGGTLNNLLFGDSKHGVNWVKNPRTTVLVALASCALTFYTWPLLCQHMADRRLEAIHELASDPTVSWTGWLTHSLGLTDPERITQAEFVAACKNDRFYKSMRTCTLPYLARAGVRNPSAEQIFVFFDTNSSGYLDTIQLEQLVKMEYDRSTMRYMLDTFAVGASAVTGTAAAVSRGLHPIICLVSPVTLCFGGILRDIICKREVSLGSQSFALCTAAGAAVYVMLRELNLRGFAVSLGLRILLTSGTTVALRLLDFYTEEPLLSPMYGDKHLPNSTNTLARLAAEHV